MSRRDTIIIAVLINAGILLVLFATAIPSGDQKSQEIQNIPVEEKIVVREDTASKENVPLPLPLPVVDEVDMVLSEWNIKPSEQVVANSDTITYQSFPVASAEPPQVQSEETGSLVAIDAHSKPQTKGDAVQVVVKKGDSLEKIAKAHGSSVQDIMTLNELSSSKLQIGQTLKVLRSTKQTSVAAALKKNTQSKKELQPKAATTPKYYTVKSGDNLSLIANKNNVRLADLLRLNNLNEEKARKLKPGDKVRIS